MVNARMGVAHVTGLQGGPDGDASGYIKTGATCKVGGWAGRGLQVKSRCRLGRSAMLQPATHSLSPTPVLAASPPLCLPQHFVGNDLEGWEGNTRYNFNAQISPQDMRDTYLVPFEGCRDAKASSFMCSYNLGEWVGWGLSATCMKGRMPWMRCELQPAAAARR